MNKALSLLSSPELDHSGCKILEPKIGELWFVKGRV